ncbi:DUF6255 family natural product biosynthesis protein [Streptomyces sp. QH1-20]|uniref:DUF6255 family natural product biosynthesis protein n=1 Tax=Streptomyces sp. QH1-20 TaxID=3240934 RepID=UPI003516227E
MGGRGAGPRESGVVRVRVRPVRGADVRAVGRLVRPCVHHSGWTENGGEARCVDCGTRRFTDYGALRPPDLPEVLTPSDHARSAADRAAARQVWRRIRLRLLPG